MTRVRVRRERPSAVAWAVALCVTMLVVYVLTLGAGGLEARSASASPRVTREVELGGLMGWCVSLAQCASAEEARIEAADYVDRGAAGYVAQLQDAWRVLGAVYDTEREARRIAERLRNEEDIPAEVLPLEAESLRLRITASEEQIDAILRADELLREQARQLGQIALQLDRDEIREEGVRALCALAASEAARALEALSAIPDAPRDRLCAALLERLSGLGEAQEALARELLGAAKLSGRLRCAQIECFLGQWELLNELGEK